MSLFLSFIQAAPATPGAGMLGNIGQVLPIVLMIAIFYFLVFRPMQRQQKNQKEMLRSLQNGQSVVTTGGIVGTIVAVNDDTLILRVKPDNIKLQVSRNAVASVIATDDAAKK
jgi:preprotein translocase subunit YajC